MTVQERLDLCANVRKQTLDEAIAAVDDLYHHAPSADFAEAIRMAVIEIEALRDHGQPAEPERPVASGELGSATPCPTLDALRHPTPKERPR